MHVDLIVILNIIVFIIIAIAFIAAMIMDKKNHKKYYESDEYDCNSDHFDLVFQIGIAIICVCAVVVSLFAISL